MTAKQAARAPEQSTQATLLGTPTTGVDASTSNSCLAAKQAHVKVPFPDHLVPFLVQKITSLETNNLTFIVESVYQDLKHQKVKKNAIEAKVREIGEKAKGHKVWGIKPDMLVSTRSLQFVSVSSLTCMRDFRLH